MQACRHNSEAVVVPLTISARLGLAEADYLALMRLAVGEFACKAYLRAVWGLGLEDQWR